MDFLVEILMGIADGAFRSEKEYVIDIDKYPKALVYIVIENISRKNVGLGFERFE